jgi:hypothetical protein
MGRWMSDLRMLIKKPLERGSGDRLRGMASDLPTLKSLQFCWESRRKHDFHSLSLAKVVGFPPRL